MYFFQNLIENKHSRYKLQTQSSKHSHLKKKKSTQIILNFEFQTELTGTALAMGEERSRKKNTVRHKEV